MPLKTLQFDSLLVLSTGEVVVRRVRPAALALRRDGVLHRITYVSVEPAAPFALGPGETYVRMAPGHVPTDDLIARGLLGPNVVAYVASPTRWHMHYAEQLLPFAGRVAVEKPLTHDAAEVAGLALRVRRPFA